jgi:hypothetical protein
VTTGTRSVSNNVVTYGATPKTKRVFLSNAVAIDSTPTGNAPVIFRYYKFPDLLPGQSILPAGSLPNVEIAANENRALNDAELGSVARITVAFRIRARTGGERAATTLKNEVYVRTADPNANVPKPTCLTY